MTRRFRVLAWVAAAATYLLIVFGAIVRITGSGMGCGDDWPLCNGHVLPPFDDLATVIEWGHRQLAVVVSVLVFAVAAYAWWIRRGEGSPKGRDGERGVPGGTHVPSVAAYWAVGLLVIQVLLGAITVKLELPHWTVVLHLATAMLLLATLLLAAVGRLPSASTRDRAAVAALAIGFVTVLLGGMTAKMGAAGACSGFPLCSGQLWPTGGGLQQLHWVHRLLAYALTLHVIGWAIRAKAVGPWAILGLVSLQVVVAAGMVMGGLPPAMQALHVAVGTAVWGALVIVGTTSRKGVAERRDGAA
jgi:heme A synthase